MMYVLGEVTERWKQQLERSRGRPGGGVGKSPRGKALRTHTEKGVRRVPSELTSSPRCNQVAEGLLQALSSPADTEERDQAGSKGSWVGREQDTQGRRFWKRPASPFNTPLSPLPARSLAHLYPSPDLSKKLTCSLNFKFSSVREI